MNLPTPSPLLALRRLPAATLLGLTTLLLQQPPAHAEAAAGGVRVLEPWVRSTAPGAEVAAAYATLVNDSAAVLTVTAAGSDAAGAVEIHEMTMRDGVMRMRALHQGIALQPHTTVRLQPGGTHLMLFDLRRPLAEGERVQLRLHLSDGQEIRVDAPVRADPPAPAPAKP